VRTAIRPAGTDGIRHAGPRPLKTLARDRSRMKPLVWRTRRACNRLITKL